MKRNTSEISVGAQKPLVIPDPADFRPEVKTQVRKGKFLDFVGRGGFRRNRGKFLFTGFFGIFLGISLLAVASAFEKKRSAENLLFFAKNHAQEALIAAKNNDFSQMQESIFSAYSSVARMKEEVSPLFSPVHFLQNSDLAAAKNLLDLAGKILEIANAAGLHFSDFSQIAQDFARGDLHSALSFLQQFRTDFTDLSEKMSRLETDLENLDSSLLPTSFREKIARLLEFSSEFKRGAQSIADLIPAAEVLMGAKYPHTIAIFFQNSGEIRATGGFPGSLAILSANDGKIDAVFRDIYYYAWKNGEFLPPPRGFERLAQRLTLRDSNSFFDFPTSAAEMRKMLELSGGPTAETIVTFSDDLFSEVLEAVGGVHIPDSDFFLTAENAPFVISFFVEGKISTTENPKQILMDILPELREKFLALPPKKWLEITKKAIEKKWILAHSNDPFVQKIIEDFGLDGAVKETKTTDFLAVVSANVGGNKSDHFLSESLNIHSTVDLSGTIHNELTISRVHGWDSEEHDLFENWWKKLGGESEIARVYLYNILGGGPNHSFSRVFVPKGSRLLSADGIPLEKIAVFEESGKTVFGFRFPAIEAGKSESISISYQLPTKVLSGDFDLFFQSQPGRNQTFLRREIFPERGISLEWGESSEIVAGGDIVFSARLQ